MKDWMIDILEIFVLPLLGMIVFMGFWFGILWIFFEIVRLQAGLY
jgi:hypothetical protein